MGGRSGWIARAATSVAPRPTSTPPPPPPITRRHCSRCGPSPPAARRAQRPRRVRARPAPAGARARRARERNICPLGSGPRHGYSHQNLRVLAFQGCRAPPAAQRAACARRPGPARPRFPPALAPPTRRVRGRPSGADSARRAPRARGATDERSARARDLLRRARAWQGASVSGRPSERELAGCNPKGGV